MDTKNEATTLPAVPAAPMEDIKIEEVPCCDLASNSSTPLDAFVTSDDAEKVLHLEQSTPKTTNPTTTVATTTRTGEDNERVPGFRVFISAYLVESSAPTRASIRRKASTPSNHVRILR